MSEKANSNPPKRTTLKDIAQIAGVNVTAVSCVLNPRRTKSSRVGPQMRERIISIAKRLNYHRNLGAAQLSGSKTKVLGALLPYITNPIFAVIAEAFENEALRNGYQSMVGSTHYDALRKRAYIQRMLEHNIDGLMLSTIWHEPEAEKSLHEALHWGIPLVFIDSPWRDHPAPLVCCNNYQGGQLLVEHLLETGHRRIGFLTSKMRVDLFSTHERLRGFEAALRGGGFEPESSLATLLAPGFRAEDYAKSVVEALRSANPPTVIMATSDISAMKLIQGLRSEGVAVPGDVAVTGFDDAYNAMIWSSFQDEEMAVPDVIPLTTVRQPLEEIGRLAVQKLINQIEEGETSRYERHFLGVELIVRESSRMPNRAPRGHGKRRAGKERA